MFKAYQIRKTIMKSIFPERIICLTEETTETIYLLGEQKRIIGISSFTVRPPIARKEKKKVCTFIDANIDEIISLNPDLVIGYSDIQADIAQKLIKRGITVWINNYRDITGILKMIGQVGMLVNQIEKSNNLIIDINANLELVKKKVKNFKIKPKIYFEEWYDPIITNIQWVSEIIELCGGINIFPTSKKESLAKDRIINSSDIILEKNPDIILVSWCGKKFKKDRLINRRGWDKISAVKYDNIYEVSSDIILQPGPASLIEGVSIIFNIIKDWINIRSE